MKKHAYLIMAHNEFEILKILLRLLDDERNDIYLHIDSKVGTISEMDFLQCVKKSKLIILKNRLNVVWGHYSQVECELRLLEASTPNKYTYYHLLSGVDLPIKSQKHIHNFFDSCDNKEFIHFDSPELEPRFLKRVQKYWLVKGRNRSLVKKAWNRALMLLQIGVDRVKSSELTYQKGANWFSITHELALYVLENRDIIETYFKHTITADEMFLQTIVASSHFINNVYSYGKQDDYTSIQREIDWERGNPYVYREEDFASLLESNKLFARKFSWSVDSNIIKLIENHILESEE